MRQKFVTTENVSRFQEALAALQRRGASEACLVVVDGFPGLGKTTTLRHWVAQTGSVYLRAKREWTPNWFLNELLGRLNVQPPHAFQQKYAVALKELGARQASAAIAKKPYGLVIDEADHISRQSRIMETIRDLSDVIELPTILVGMGKIRDNLGLYPQIASRISKYVRFETASRDDVARMIAELCEVPVASDLAGFVHQVTGGFNRETKEAIAQIERFGLRNPPKDAAGLTLADMAGEAIVNGRRTTQPIYVPEAV